MVSAVVRSDLQLSRRIIGLQQLTQDMKMSNIRCRSRSLMISRKSKHS